MISNTVYKRSVLKNMKTKNSGLVATAKSSGDAVVSQNVTGNVVSSIKTGKFPLYMAYNELCVKGATPVVFNASIVIPFDFDEGKLKKIVCELEKCGAKLGIDFGDCAVSHSKNVCEEIISVCAIGLLEQSYTSQNAKCGEDIVMVGHIGSDGIKRVIEKKPEEAFKYYSEDFINEALGKETGYSVKDAAKLSLNHGASCLQCVGEGGIFAGLWYLAEKNNVGLEVELKKINVKQEIIELCEVYDINPYELSSLGCLLVTSSDGCGIVELLSSHGIRATIIGKVTDNCAKILRLNDEVRYLDVPRSEEANRFEF